MLKRITGTITFLLFLVFILTACGSRKDGFSSSESGYTDAQLSLGGVNRFAGVVVSGKETKVDKSSDKKVKSLKVSVGDTVKKGDVLFTYDGSQAQYDYDKAELEIEQMRMSLESYAAQRAELEAEKAKAPATEQLSYTIQIQELDTTIRETEYNITQKEKDLENMKEGLGDLKVYAPVDGKIKSINKSEMESGGDDSASPDEEGDSEDMLADIPDTGTTSQAFIVITQTNAFRVKAFMNEENIRSLTKGDPVTIRSRIDDTTWEGEVADIDTGNPQQDQSGYYEGDDSEVTSSSKYPFFVDLKESEGLILGQHVYVELYMESYVLPEDEEGGDEEDFEDEDFREEGDDAEIPIGMNDLLEGED